MTRAIDVSQHGAARVLVGLCSCSSSSSRSCRCTIHTRRTLWRAWPRERVDGVSTSGPTARERHAEPPRSRGTGLDLHRPFRRVRQPGHRRALGLIAGFFGGVSRALIMGLADLQLSIPRVLLLIAVTALFGPTVLNLTLLLGITSWVAYGRVARAMALSLREREFVLSASRRARRRPGISASTCCRTSCRRC